MPELEHYIAVGASTALCPVPFAPELSLHAAEDAYAVWEITNRQTPSEAQTPVPYWSFPWAGGQAIARYILDHPDLVRGRRVLDVAAGSGLVAIAAAMAGAKVAVANDIDDFAAAAQDLNARANQVTIDIVMADLLDTDINTDPDTDINTDPGSDINADPGSDINADPGSDINADPGAGRSTGYDVVLAGDVCYEREFSARILRFLHRAAQGGAVVLLGDPGRTYLPADGLAEIATYDVPTTLALENSETKRTTIWRPVS